MFECSKVGTANASERITELQAQYKEAMESLEEQETELKKVGSNIYFF